MWELGKSRLFIPFSEINLFIGNRWLSPLNWLTGLELTSFSFSEHFGPGWETDASLCLSGHWLGPGSLPAGRRQSLLSNCNLSSQCNHQDRGQCSEPPSSIVS